MSRKPIVKTPAFIVRLKAALHAGLAQLDIPPTDVLFEAVPGTKLFRCRIVAPKFSKLRHLERQDLVWRLVRKELGEEGELHISTITTLTPSEAKQVA